MIWGVVTARPHIARSTRTGAAFMPIPQPLKQILTVARKAVDIVPDTIIAAAAHYPASRPQPAPLDYRGVVIRCNEGVIETVTDPASYETLRELRDRTISNSDGAMSVTIVAAAVGAQLKPGMLTRSILDVMAANQARGYQILLGG
jgi:hypothetical protein